MNDVTSIDSALSKPQLLRVLRKYQQQALGMHQIAKSLSTDNLDFAQEAFEVFAGQLDDIAYGLGMACAGDLEWFDREFGSRRERA